MKKVKIYDTTLRDGTQSEDISFSPDDKWRIAHKLDEMGIHYIEGGFLGSNPRDKQFFSRLRKEKLDRSRVVAFGMTPRAGRRPNSDPGITALLASNAPVVAVVGKSWDLHVRDIVGITLGRNLECINETLNFLKGKFDEVFFDAEHFFDGFLKNSDYAIKTLLAAQDARVDCIFLCDTNGGTLTRDIRRIVREVKKRIKIPIGIHAHNDSDLAVANTLTAVEAGVGIVQGTINGFGERCGNANLCSVIPNLKLKYGIDCIDDDGLRKLKDISRFITELANLPHNKHQPYVGNGAFAHKGGIHISAVRKNPITYEHIAPESVGNYRRSLISDLSGKSIISQKASKYGMDLKGKGKTVKDILSKLKDLEGKGFQFEGAEGSFELLIRKALGKEKKYFRLIGFRVIDEKRVEKEPPYSEATIMIEVDGKVEHTASVGVGPVSALDNALRKALEKFYPEINEMRLTDYKVRVVSAGEGTGASVRVLIESEDRDSSWGTVGVSHNIIEASWQALVDSIAYKLYNDEKRGGNG